MGGMAIALILPLAERATAISISIPYEHFLCMEEAAVVARVIDARSHDQGKMINRRPFAYIGVTARVEEVILPNTGNLHVGDRIKAAFMVGRQLRPDERVGLDGYSGVALFPAGEKFTDATARSQLVGMELLLAATPVSRSKGPFDSPSDVGEPYRAWVYPMDLRNWVTKTWTHPDCKHRPTEWNFESYGQGPEPAAQAPIAQDGRSP